MQYPRTFRYGIYVLNSMAFINPVWFRMGLPQITIMEFIARILPEYYLMGFTGSTVYHAVVISAGVVECFTNEFVVLKRVMASSVEVKKVLHSCSKCWDNRELLDL